MPVAKKVTPKIEIEPGVFLIGSYVVFEKEHMTWPLPRPDADHSLRYDEPPSRQACLAAAFILSAYEQMLFDSVKKRQRVIRCLRKALEVRT